MSSSRTPPPSPWRPPLHTQQQPHSTSSASSSRLVAAPSVPPTLGASKLLQQPDAPQQFETQASIELLQQRQAWIREVAARRRHLRPLLPPLRPVEHEAKLHGIVPARPSIQALLRSLLRPPASSIPLTGAPPWALEALLSDAAEHQHRRLLGVRQNIYTAGCGVNSCLNINQGLDDIP
ncbi:hypothetical protein U9M48_001001 [Paspalum notatum var. saurae]|uniref:Uncharacterized protein n=1 Tax=Paspalum notatum var. saurae TaxID=547442 RepID=A0AAQ3PFE6_PASNO